MFSFFFKKKSPDTLVLSVRLAYLLASSIGTIRRDSQNWIQLYCCGDGTENVRGAAGHVKVHCIQDEDSHTKQ